MRGTSPCNTRVRRILKIREADPERAIVYTDEIWLNQGHRTKKEWVDLEMLQEKNLRSLRLSGLTVGCTKEMTSKGRRLWATFILTISIRAGACNGQNSKE